jgi:UrcA family protein
MNTMNRIAACIALVSVTGLAFGAAVTGDPPQRTVSYADLDLSHKAGAEILFSRIKSAARDVCEPQLGLELASRTVYHRCVDQAIGRAVADVNAAGLAALYRAGSAQ